MTAVYSVSELNRYAGELLSSDPILSSVRVRGEISGCKKYPSGHIYFSLKDKECQINCVAFRGNASLFSFAPDNGLSVVVTARATLYDRDGRFQLVVYDMELGGIGDLFVQYEKLKAKLEAEGLFDERVKKPIPFLPKRIGVITSPKGAVIRDIVQILTRRYPNFDVLIYPSAVQGATAAKTLREGVLWFNTHPKVDVIVIARGGGSAEDLYCFNDEALARAIHASTIPVISAVGHETDFTICDFVSDLRAPTPSAAAELIMPVKEEWHQRILGKRDLLQMFLTGRIDRKRQKLAALSGSNALAKPMHRVELFSQRIDMMVQRMDRSLVRNLNVSGTRLHHQIERLDALSPLKILIRGYSVVTDHKSDKPITSIKKIVSGQKLRIFLADGAVHCTTDSVETRGGLL